MVSPLILVTLLATGCARDMEVANDPTVPPAVSPPAISSLPDDIEELTLTVANGQFDVDDLFLLEGAPTLMHVANNDAQVHVFQIEEALVNPTELPANAITDVPFTTPNAGEFEGQLIEADSADVLDTVRVVVRSPGGLTP